MTTKDSITINSAHAPQHTIPKTKKQRDSLRQLAYTYAAEKKLTAPLSISELQQHGSVIIKENNINTKYLNFISILLSNAVWHDTVIATPYEKRLLLLPQCLRDHKHCPASIDSIGLICEHCGRCLIHSFKRQAEALGYAVLIAEGSPVVMSLIETRQIQAIIGVSCLSTLERVYPYMEAAAVPGIAIALLHDGCINTHIDADWLWEILYETSDTSVNRLDLDNLRTKVNTWFTYSGLSKLMQANPNNTMHLACDWMARAGKRWRPLLTAGTYKALTQTESAQLHQVAVAVECFHKASLIHDDIEDNDSLRYNSPTMHIEYNLPIALNTGDALLGEGYRLLTDTDMPAEIKIRLLQIAAHGHRSLCLGQGAELTWAQNPKPLSVQEIISIFRQKTAPAFAVALNCGAVLAGCDKSLEKILSSYSEDLGIAYQIRDDLDDLLQNSMDLIKRPSILMALAYEQANSPDKDLLDHAWYHPDTDRAAEVIDILKKMHIDHKAALLMEVYKANAIAHLAHIHNPALKGLLRQIISKIFLDFDIMGCCNDTHKNE